MTKFIYLYMYKEFQAAGLIFIMLSWSWGRVQGLATCPSGSTSQELAVNTNRGQV